MLSLEHANAKILKIPRILRKKVITLPYYQFKHTMNPKYFAFFAISLALFAHASEPAGYYSACENKGGRQLLEALHAKVGPHTTVSYDALLDLYKTSDVYPDGKIWDMYSTKHWTIGNTCGNYKKIGDCYNREHSLPKSWFSERAPMKSDAFHVYPTDGKVNGQRSNYPYGECEGGTKVASSGGVEALGRLGKSTFSGYTGTVFEPDDEYKGDFARSYFYMAAAYYDKISSWSSPMLAGNSFPAYSPWAVQLLLKWHRQDPVSDKELDRNDVVYGSQKNRNPFIDHPEMVEYIWGNCADQQWSYSVAANPEINSPVDGSTVNIGTTARGKALGVPVNIRTSSLDQNLNVSVSGDFTASATTISPSETNSKAGYPLTVTFLASAVGKANGQLILSSGNITTTVNLIAEAVDGLPAAAPADITDCGFTALWTYIGDDDSNGCYQLYVLDQDDAPLPSYPKAVNAAAGRYQVDDLDPESDYTYYLKSMTMESRHFFLTTAAPLPSIEFFFDGDLYLTSMPGEPSETVEIEIETENIEGPITVSVTAPFELSADHNTWSTSLTLPVGTDRMYMRLYGDVPGEYSSSIVAVAGEYHSDDAVVEGRIGSVTNFIEDFEQPGTNSYTTANFHGTSGDWIFSNAGVYDTDHNVHSGEKAVRFGKTATSYIEMAADKSGGIGIVTLYAAKWPSDGEATFELQYSSDQGQSWSTAGTASTNGNDYNQYTFTVNCRGDVRLRLQQTAGSRWMVDDIEATRYDGNSSVEDIDGYHGWDAYCSGGKLIVRLSVAGLVKVYDLAGITRYSAHCLDGETELTLPAGYYLVSVNGRVRRVVVAN